MKPNNGARNNNQPGPFGLRALANLRKTSFCDFWDKKIIHNNLYWYDQSRIIHPLEILVKQQSIATTSNPRKTE